MSNAIETLEKTGTPTAILATFKAYEDAGARIRGQQFQAQRETEEFTKLAQATAARLVVQFAKEVTAADAEMDKQLRAVDAEELERMRLPTKREFESEGEFANRLTKRTIEELRRAADVNLHVADVQTIAITKSPAIILEIVQDAIASAPPEAAKRLLRTAEVQAAALAAEETRDGGVPGQAFQVHLQIQDLHRRWRGQLPDAKREGIKREHTIKTMQLKTNLIAGARLLGIEKTVEAAFMKAAAHE